MGGIIATQLGVFNRCSCYTRWGATGLALPENEAVGNTLFWRIDTAYPAVAFACVGFCLVVVPGWVLGRYGDAVRVFLQRDDGKSNLRWVGGFMEKTDGVRRWFGKRFVGLSGWVMERKRMASYEMTEGVGRRPSSVGEVGIGGKSDEENGYSEQEFTGE